LWVRGDDLGYDHRWKIGSDTVKNFRLIETASIVMIGVSISLAAYILAAIAGVIPL
jgi:hypothetical protein